MITNAIASAVILLFASTAGEEWTQPPIRTAPASVEALPWVTTIDEALARAKAEKKLVLATIVAVSDDHWVGGYAGANELWKSLGPPVFGADVSAANDAGLRKERVMMAGWFADPDVAALVRKYFVPVRVRCRPWDFDVDFPTDPLQPLGTKLDAVGAPALVIAKSDGTCVHSLGRIGVFAPEVASASLRAALAKAGVRDVPARAGTAAKPADEVRKFAEEFGLDLDAWTKGATIEFDPSARTTEIDATRQNIEKVLGRAADVLLALQSADGGWPNPAFDVRVIGGRGTQWDYEVPRSALAVDALLRLRERLPARKEALEAAARRGLEVVGKFADAPEPWIWQVTYALHLQISVLRIGAESDKPAARARAAKLVEALASLQQDGGWSYCSSPRTHSFNTALVLLELGELESLGVAAPKESTKRAQAFLASLRNPADARDYWYAPALKFEPRASTCRSALCELALLTSGDESASRRLGPAVEFFFEGEAGARSVTKIYENYLSPVPLQDAYHYYFGHYYVARALARLPADKRQSLARRQLALILGQVEADGSFVDAQEQGKSYSTAMAVLALLEDLRYTNR
jgi:hypothetical protein